MTVRRVLLVLAAVAIIIGSAALYFVIKYSDDNISAFLVRRGTSAEEAGKDMRAAWLYEEAVNRSPDSVEARLALARVSRRLGNVALAEKELLECVALPGDTVGAYTELSSLYVETDRLLDASKLFADVKSDIARVKLGSIRPSPPQFFPIPGRYSSDTVVSLSGAGSGAVCYFTTDGSEPTCESDVWESDMALPLGETTIKALCVAENGLVSDMTEASWSVSDDSAVVTFKDASIEAMARAALSRYAGHITAGELRQITSMSNRTEDGRRIGDDITTFSDLQFFSGLCELSIYDTSSLPDPGGLAAVPELTSLSLVNCGLTDAELIQIASLTDLLTLNVSDNRLTDMSALSELRGLYYLNVSHNFISDLTPLLLLPGLEGLDISGNPVSSLETVGFIPSLRHLSAASCGLSDAGPLSALADAVYIDISGNRISNIEPLSSCSSLETLLASDNLIGGLYPLSGLTRLAVLDVSDNLIMNLNPLANMSSLRTLDITRNQVTDLGPLRSCLGLVSVFADENPVSGSAEYVFGESDAAAG